MCKISFSKLLATAFLALMLDLGVHAAAYGDSLYIGDGGTDDGGADDTIKRFNANTGLSLDNFVTPNSGGLNGPKGMIIDGNRLVVVNQNVSTDDFPVDYAGEILNYRRNNGVFINALVPCNPPRDGIGTCDINAPFAPRGMIKGKDQSLIVASQAADDTVPTPPGAVKRYASKSGLFLDDFDITGFTPAFFPRGVVQGPDKLIYVSVVGDLNPAVDDDGNPTNPIFNPIAGYILRFNPVTGKFVDVFAAFDPASATCSKDLHRPEGLVFGPNGKLYITSFRADATDTDKILVFDRRTKQCVDQIALDVVGQPRSFAQALLFGPNGKLFVPINNTGEVRRYNVRTKMYDIFVPAGGDLTSPWYLTFGETDPRTLEYDD